MPSKMKRRQGKQGSRKTPLRNSASNSISAADQATNAAAAPNVAPELILTSAKRRGVYECDYCQSDISQLPRIRCAICPEFDLCLDCFVNTDHGAATTRLRAAANAHQAVGAGSSGLTLTALNHDVSHGYRVCDSTRYPVFASSRQLALVRSSAVVSNNNQNQNDSNTNFNKSSTDVASVEDSITNPQMDPKNDGNVNNLDTVAQDDNMQVEPTNDSEALNEGDTVEIKKPTEYDKKQDVLGESSQKTVEKDLEGTHEPNNNQKIVENSSEVAASEEIKQKDMLTSNEDNKGSAEKSSFILDENSVTNGEEEEKPETATNVSENVNDVLEGLDKSGGSAEEKETGLNAEDVADQYIKSGKTTSVDVGDVSITADRVADKTTSVDVDQLKNIKATEESKEDTGASEEIESTIEKDKAASDEVTASNVEAAEAREEAAAVSEKVAAETDQAATLDEETKTHDAEAKDATEETSVLSAEAAAVTEHATAIDEDSAELNEEDKAAAMEAKDKFEDVEAVFEEKTASNDETMALHEEASELNVEKDAAVENAEAKLEDIDTATTDVTAVHEIATPLIEESRSPNDKVDAAREESGAAFEKVTELREKDLVPVEEADAAVEKAKAALVDGIALREAASTLNEEATALIEEATAVNEEPNTLNGESEAASEDAATLNEETIAPNEGSKALNEEAEAVFAKATKQNVQAAAVDKEVAELNEETKATTDKITTISEEFKSSQENENESAISEVDIKDGDSTAVAPNATTKAGNVGIAAKTDVSGVNELAANEGIQVNTVMDVDMEDVEVLANKEDHKELVPRDVDADTTDENISMEVDANLENYSTLKKVDTGLTKDSTIMEVDTGSTNEGATTKISVVMASENGSVNTNAANVCENDVFVYNDPKNTWTVEEDLRLIEGIETHGLGNWAEISEMVSGLGSTGKTPKRCMERYFDDYLGRYGHILPPYMLVEVDDGIEGDKLTTELTVAVADDDPVRASKRRSSILKSPESHLNLVNGPRRRYKVVPTESTVDMEKVWPSPYIPPIGVQIGQEVGRDSAYKAEQAYVKLIESLESKEEVERVRQEWEETRLNKPGGPTVLPHRPEDIAALPGADLLGFMPRRGDFDVEWENDAEQAVADMEFIPGEPDEDRQLKLQVLEIYSLKITERERRKQFVLSRQLYDYRKHQEEEQKLPRDERDLVHRMRLFERFHTPEEHKQFIDDILKAKRLRKEIAKLLMYNRIGIKTLSEAEKYEIDKSRRHYHKMALSQKGLDPVDANAKSGRTDEMSSASLWKQYKTNDRRARRSVNRGGNDELDSVHVSESVSDTREKQQEQQQYKDSNLDPAHRQNIGTSPLSESENELCLKLKLSPQQYIEIKHALIFESMAKGLLDREGPGSNKRTIAKLDVERRGNVIDFVVKAGWVSPKVGNIARQVTSEEQT